MLQSKHTTKLLILILLIAAFLRTQGIFWGIPIFDPLVHSYHPDELKIIYAANSFPGHIFTNTDFRYPTFYHNFIGILSLPFKLIFKLNNSSFNIMYITILGRSVSILLGIGSIFLTFVLGKRLYNENVGLLAAIFLSLSLYHVQSSSLATLDVPNSFFFILTLYFAFRMYEEPKPIFYLLTGVSLGILVGTKYFGGLILISILILHYYRTSNNVSGTSKNSFGLRMLFSKNLCILFLSAAITFFLTTPGILLNPMNFVNSETQELTQQEGLQYRSMFGISVFLLIIKNFMEATDPFLGLFMLFGLLYPLQKHWNKEIPLLAPLIPIFLIFGALRSRHFITILPLTAILGANAAFRLYETKRILKNVWIFLFTLWIIFSLTYNSAGILLRKDDSRIEAAHYIDRNIPAGATIGATSIGNYPRWSWEFPMINPQKYRIVDAFEKPEIIILTSYDYENMEKALSSGKLHDYKWQENKSREWYLGKAPSEEVFRFYDDILNKKNIKYNYTMIQKFERNNFVPIEFPPPQIRIYERAED